MVLLYWVSKKKGVTKMESEFEWREFVDRAQKFHWNVELIKKQIAGNEFYFRVLYSLKKDIVNELDETGKLREKQVLEKVFLEIYNFAIRYDEQFIIFAEGVDPFVQGVHVYESVYEACFFTVLCMFLHDTKRIDGKSLRRFVYDNSLEYYNDKKSPNYFHFDSSSSDKLLNEESTLRKTRNRRLSDRPVYNKRTEWSAMSKDSEHEWTYYYILEVIGDEEKDTYEIKCLLDCEDGDEEKDILVKSIILKDIHYPKVYKDFASFSDLPLIQNYTQVFNKFRYMV